MTDQLPAILELREVSKTYRQDLLQRPQRALVGFSCAFAAGQCTALLGHNGAGKTTAIRLILGLVRPDSGQILFEGGPLTTAARAAIGYMPEVNKLAHGLTPREILNHTLLLYGTRGGRGERRLLIDHKLADVGLGDHAHKLVGQLSKGMARRLAWAQATIHRPRLLILDEPASGLDPVARRRMVSWIAAEKARGAAILLCTHEMSQVATLGDACNVLQRGRLVFSSVRRSHGHDGPTHVLHVSGLGGTNLVAKVAAFAGANQLPPPSSTQAAGELAILGFGDYGAAASWLGACLRQGLIVTRFADEGWLGGEALLTHLEGEP